MHIHCLPTPSWPFVSPSPYLTPLGPLLLVPPPVALAKPRRDCFPRGCETGLIETDPPAAGGSWGILAVEWVL